MFISFPVVGLGFGMMSGVFSLVNVLADSVGPGTVGFNDEPQDFFMISSLLCMAMILLHTFWGVIAFDAWDQRKWLNLIYVWASHLTVSCLVSIPLFFFIILEKGEKGLQDSSIRNIWYLKFIYSEKATNFSQIYGGDFAKFCGLLRIHI